MITVRIDGEVVQWLYRDADGMTAHPYDERHGLLLSVDPLRSSAVDETANLSITLANNAGQASVIFFADPPIGRTATVFDDGIQVFAGVIESNAFSGDTYTLDIIA